MDKNDNIVMISKDIRANERYIRERLADCGDIQIRKMRLGDARKVDCLMVYIEVATSNMMLEDSVVGKFINQLWTLPEEQMRSFVEKNGAGISDTGTFETLEEALEWINDDELVEITPDSIRLRKKGLKPHERRQYYRERVSDEVK